MSVDEFENMADAEIAEAALDSNTNFRRLTKATRASIPKPSRWSNWPIRFAN